MRNWSSVTHQVHRLLKRENVFGRRERPLKLGVSVSGGADSVALICILHDLAPALKLQLRVIHFHHGPHHSANQVDGGCYRDQAMQLTSRIAHQFGLEITVRTSEKDLQSENEMRGFRRAALIEEQKSGDLDFIVTAHHADDLLETRLMRLIRGTGRVGLQAIRVRRGIWLRPLLELTHSDLVMELKNRRVEWVEDPSNQDAKYFRNWLRRDWLPLLEMRQPGSLRRLGLSLENLAFSKASRNSVAVFLAANVISRPIYLKMSVSEQKQSVAELFFRLKMTDYSHSQIEEVRKRLDNSQTQHIFVVSDLEWRVNAEQISVCPVNARD